MQLEPDRGRRKPARSAFDAESEDQAPGYQDSQEGRGLIYTTIATAIRPPAARVRGCEKTRGHCCCTLARKEFPKLPRNVPGFFPKVAGKTDLELQIGRAHV